MLTNSRNVNLTLLKNKLSLSVLTVEHLESIINNYHKVNQTKSTLYHDINNNVNNIDKEYLQRALIKLKRIKKHNEWKKKRKQSIKQKKEFEKEKSKDSHDISSTSQPTTVFQLQNKTQNKSIEKTSFQVNKQQQRQQQQQQLKELSCKIAKLYQLRNLRRKKLEAQGHFFPDEGNEFYNKIKTSIEKEEEEKEEEEEEENEEVLKNEKEEKEEKEESAFYIDKDDHWELHPLDRDAYQYWLQGWQSVTALKRIRHQWDYYLINDDDQPSSSLHPSNDYKVPPFWVTPPPPSHPIWASYLEKN